MLALHPAVASFHVILPTELEVAPQRLLMPVQSQMMTSRPPSHWRQRIFRRFLVEFVARIVDDKELRIEKKLAALLQIDLITSFERRRKHLAVRPALLDHPCRRSSSQVD